jgi:hypothetical protein
VTYHNTVIKVTISAVDVNILTMLGPFRIYTEMSVTVDVTINNLPSWLQSIVRIFTSTALIVTLIR